MTTELKFVLGRVENIVGKGENAGSQHVLLFHQCFKKLSFSGFLKSGIDGYGVKHSHCKCWVFFRFCRQGLMKD